MIWYVLKLLLLLPLIGALAWGCLKLAQRMQARLGAAPDGARVVHVVETLMLSPTQRLAVIRFHDREILVACGKGGLNRLAEAPAREAQP